MDITTTTLSLITAIVRSSSSSVSGDSRQPGPPLHREDAAAHHRLKTDNPEPFTNERVSRFGNIFTTHVFGQGMIFSVDPEVNRFMLLNKGKLFDCSYPTPISNLLGRHSLLMKGSLHKKMHSLVMSFANSAIITDHLLLDIDQLV